MLDLKVSGSIVHDSSGTRITGNASLEVLGQSFASTISVVPPDNPIAIFFGAFRWTGSVGFSQDFSAFGAGAKLSGKIYAEVSVWPQGTPQFTLTFEGKACAKNWVKDICKGRKESITIGGDMCISFPVIGKKCINVKPPI